LLLKTDPGPGSVFYSTAVSLDFTKCIIIKEKELRHSSKPVRAAIN